MRMEWLRKASIKDIIQQMRNVLSREGVSDQQWQAIDSVPSDREKLELSEEKNYIFEISDKMREKIKQWANLTDP